MFDAPDSYWTAATTSSKYLVEQDIFNEAMWHVVPRQDRTLITVTKSTKEEAQNYADYLNSI